MKWLGISWCMPQNSGAGCFAMVNGRSQRRAFTLLSYGNFNVELI